MMHPTQIPIYVEADSKNELIEKMAIINSKSGAWHNFFSIYKEGKKHVAWYYGDVEEMVKRKVNGTTNNNRR